VNPPDSFFERPILNSPNEYPGRHWELDEQGPPTGQLLERRRPAESITPNPKPQKRKTPIAQQALVFEDPHPPRAGCVL
jgi:type III restriction enzyme